MKLRDKSEFNIDAAQILFDANLYAPSVHCSYYSCFQLIKHTIKYFFGIEYETLAKNIVTSKQKTHTYVIGYVVGEIKKLGGARTK